MVKSEMFALSSTFEKMLTVDINKHVKLKQNQKFLSWAWAWSEFKKANPDATYKISTFDDVPYKSTNLGIMCYTSVTLNGETLSMWLPVMNGANKALKEVSYSYYVKDFKTKALIEKVVEPATMFDINKTLMRCLVKNLAMFGLGLYIYAGEDFAEIEVLDSSQLQEIMDKIKTKKMSLTEVCRSWQIDKIAELHVTNFENMVKWLDGVE